MSFTPTILAPVFVVQKLVTGAMVYYREDDEGKGLWTQDPNEARIFMTLHSAHRVASATAAEVRVLVNKDDLSDFRPKGEL